MYAVRRGLGKGFEKENGFTSIKNAAVAQLVECVLGKDEVMGPNPISSSVGISGRGFGLGIMFVSMSQKLWLRNKK